MRLSCNGCRILRKGCNESCSIKPCLDWIQSPEAQANATLFLAKFYGRAGLLNLINAGPHPSRPAIFRSLLYEACGRIVNPVYGSAGLLTSGSWELCQAAVEAVLSGAPIVKLSADSPETNNALSSSPTPSPPLKACNIRHVAREEKLAAKDRGLHKVRGRGGFKKSGAKPKQRERSPDVKDAAEVIWSWSRHKEDVVVVGSPSHESGLSQHVEPPSQGGDSGGWGECVEESVAKLDESEVELELTLGFEPFAKPRIVGPATEEICNSRDATCKMELIK